MDLRVPMEAGQEAFGIPVTVKVPFKSAVAATGIWLPPDTRELPVGGELQRAVPQKVLALSKAEVPELPRDTVIDGPEYEGGPVKSWKIDGMVLVDDEHHRVVVVERELFP